MNFVKSSASSLSEAYKNSNAEIKLEIIEISLSNKNIDEPRDSQTFMNEKSLNQTSNRKQIQTDNQLEDVENEMVKKIQTKKCILMKKQIIHIIDCLIATIIVGPMVVAHWRGVWVLMDFYENIFSGWLCFGLGMGLHLLFAILKHPLHETFAAGTKFKGPCGRLGCRFVRTLYTYVFSLACNCHWRGAWIVLKDCFGAQSGVIICFTYAVLGNLIALRCIRNLLAPPFLITLDSPKFIFQFPTRYKTVSTKTYYYSSISKFIHYL